MIQKGRVNDNKVIFLIMKVLQSFFGVTCFYNVKKTILREHLTDEITKTFIFITNQNGFGKIHN